MRALRPRFEVPAVLTVTVIAGLSGGCSSPTPTSDAGAADVRDDVQADARADAHDDVQADAHARDDAHVDAHDDVQADAHDAHADAQADVATGDRPRFDAGSYACKHPVYDQAAGRWRCAPCFAPDGVQVGCMACVLPNDPDGGTQVIC